MSAVFGVKATFYILDIFGENWRIPKKVGLIPIAEGIGHSAEKSRVLLG